MPSLSVMDVLARYYQEKGLSAEQVTREPSFQKLPLDQQAALMHKYASTFTGTPSLVSSLASGMPSLGLGIAIAAPAYMKLLKSAVPHMIEKGVANRAVLINDGVKILGVGIPATVLGAKLLMNYNDHREQKRLNNSLVRSKHHSQETVASNILHSESFTPHDIDPMYLMTGVSTWASGHLDDRAALQDAVTKAIKRTQSTRSAPRR